MAPADTKPILVVSHERSGTHFLMNALAAEFGYTSRPMVNFDHGGASINFYDPGSILKYFMTTEAQRPEVLRKSHHQVAFFERALRHVVKHVNIFYIHRDPRDAMHSFRHAMFGWKWFEGPRVETAGEFIRAAPCGQMLRYQYHQHADMLERWKVHVEGWTAAAERFPERITVVRFEDLEGGYDAALDRIAAARGWARQRGPRLEIDRDSILTSHRDSPSNVYTEADLAWFRDRVGPTMRRLGYEI